ncbi:MAG: SEC-C domain-containing protein [Spirochaetales bacterium]
MTANELASIQEAFPDLYLEGASNTLRGEMSFDAHFDGAQLHLNGIPDRRYRRFSGCFCVLIDLNQRDLCGLFKVWEVGGKLETVIKERQLAMCLDAHVNGDGSCCVGIFLPIEVQRMSVVRFVREVVFSYFAWHAYWETFNEKAPWGEYSHQNGIDEKIHDTMKLVSRLGRNARCYCGSGKKYKLCCLPRLQAAHQRRPA